MKLASTVRWSFISSLILTPIATYLQLTHYEGAGILLILAAVLILLFIASAIYEVITSKSIDNSEKTIWTLSFIFFSGITGFIYFFIGRKRIVPVD